MSQRTTLLIALWLVGCSGGQDDTDTGALSDTDPQLPADPRPVTVEVGGGWTGSIVFDSPSCINYPPNVLTNFRQFWRGQHNAVLIIEVLGAFEGAGDYTTTTDNLRVRLQSEAGEDYTMSLAVDGVQGDSATLSIDHISTVAWGEATLTGMHGQVDGADVGAVTVTSPLPIYCPSVAEQ